MLHTNTRSNTHALLILLIGFFFAKLVCAYLSGGFIDKHLKLKKKEKSTIRSVNLAFVFCCCCCTGCVLFGIAEINLFSVDGLE